MAKEKQETKPEKNIAAEVNPLLDVTKHWMSLERKTEKQRQVAEEYYEKNVFSLVEKDYVKRNQELLLEEVNYMIMTVGTSYEPLILNIQLFKPKKILFLCTEQTEIYLDKIVSYCKLSPSKYQKTIVNESEAIDIYSEIKKNYLRWNKPDKVYIDFTGGTKAMSAAVALAGAMINVQLVYVGNTEYLVQFRKPRPGSECLKYIANPIETFGDLEIEKAFALFEKKNYAGAAEKLLYLKEQVPEPDIRQQLCFAYLLARTYEAWDSLEFDRANANIKQLIAELQRDKGINTRFLLMDQEGLLLKQSDLLEALSKIPELIKEKKHKDIMSSESIMYPLMFTMCANALLREEQGKLDMATLLLYRLLEMIEQFRLMHYNLYVSAMDYSAIYIPDAASELSHMSKESLFDEVKKRYLGISRQLFGRVRTSYIPDQISLLEGYILLLALDDDICRLEKGNNIDLLKRMRAMVYLRNNSIFAHGLGPVRQEDYEKFKMFVVSLFQKFCRLEQIDFVSYENMMHWISPSESKYCSGLVGK